MNMDTKYQSFCTQASEYISRRAVYLLHSACQRKRVEIELVRLTAFGLNSFITFIDEVFIIRFPRLYSFHALNEEVDSAHSFKVWSRGLVACSLSTYEE